MNSVYIVKNRVKEEVTWRHGIYRGIDIYYILYNGDCSRSGVRLCLVGTIIYVRRLLGTVYTLSVGTICVWFGQMDGLRVKRNTGRFSFIITRNCL